MSLIRHHRHGLNRLAQLLGLTVTQVDRFMAAHPQLSRAAIVTDPAALAEARALVEAWLSGS